MKEKSNVHSIFDGRAILVSTDRVAVYLHGTAAQITVAENEIEKRGGGATITSTICLYTPQMISLLGNMFMAQMLASRSQSK